MHCSWGQPLRGLSAVGCSSHVERCLLHCWVGHHLTMRIRLHPLLLFVRLFVSSTTFAVALLICEQLMPHCAGMPYMQATACTGLGCCSWYRATSRRRRWLWQVTVGAGACGVQLPPAHTAIPSQCMQVDIGKQVHDRVRELLTGPCTVGPEKSRQAPSCVCPCMHGRFTSVRWPSSQSVPAGCAPW